MSLSARIKNLLHYSLSPSRECGDTLKCTSCSNIKPLCNFFSDKAELLSQTFFTELTFFKMCLPDVCIHYNFTVQVPLWETISVLINTSHLRMHLMVFLTDK